MRCKNGLYSCSLAVCAGVSMRRLLRVSLIGRAGLFAWLLTAFLSNAWAIGTVELSSENTRYSLGGKVFYLEDPQGTLAVQDVVTKEGRRLFRQSEGQSPNMGFTTSVYWFAIDLYNKDATVSDWLLELQYPMLDYVDVHLVYRDASRQPVSYHGGDMLPFSSREIKHRNLLFRVPLEQGELVSVLIRVKTDSSMQLPLTLWTSQTLLEREHSEYITLGIYYGILVAMLLFNLMIYVSIRDINYLYYVVYLASVILFQSTLNGLAFEYLWPDNPWWANVSTPFSIGLVYAAIIQFSREFLQLRRHMPRIDHVFKGYLVLFLLVMVASFIVNYTIAIKVATFLTMTATLLLFSSGALCLRAGVLHAKYFMLAWTVLLLFVFVYTLKTFGFLPNVFITEYGLQIGAALETILLSYALAHRLRLLRLENESIQRGITETLETRVRERTLELDNALLRLAEANQKLTEMSQTDTLTGLYNRARFNEIIISERNRAQRSGKPLSLLLLDIDHFKHVNDTYGHQGGDICLKEVAKGICSVLLRPGDAAFRLGGEEFVVLLPNTPAQGAYTVAERIREVAENLEIWLDGKRIGVTVSIGVCTTELHNSLGGETLLRYADLAMYKAKSSGRNRVCVYAPEKDVYLEAKQMQAGSLSSR